MNVIRALHRWLGILVIPWVLLLGVSGLLLNHSDAVLPMLPQSSYDEARFDDWPDQAGVDLATARGIAEAVFPDLSSVTPRERRYHGRDAYEFAGKEGRVIVTRTAGFYWVKTGHYRYTFDPAGRQVDKKTYWKSWLRSLHSRGQTDANAATWMADIGAGAMILYALSGLALFVRSRGQTPASPPPETLKVSRSKVKRPRRITLEREG